MKVAIAYIEEPPFGWTTTPVHASLPPLTAAVENSVEFELTRVPTVNGMFPLLTRLVVMTYVVVRPTAWSMKEPFGGNKTAEFVSATPVPERFAVNVAVLLLP